MPADRPSLSNAKLYGVSVTATIPSWPVTHGFGAAAGPPASVVVDVRRHGSRRSAAIATRAISIGTRHPPLDSVGQEEENADRKQRKRKKPQGSARRPSNWCKYQSDEDEH